jgi:hypothetical protein
LKPAKKLNKNWYKMMLFLAGAFFICSICWFALEKYTYLAICILFFIINLIVGWCNLDG